MQIIQRGRLIGLLSVLVAGWAIASCSPTSTETATDGSSGNAAESVPAQSGSAEQIVLAIGGESEEGYDPTLGWGRYGAPLFQSTLLKRDENLEIVNDLATELQR